MYRPQNKTPWRFLDVEFDFLVQYDEQKPPGRKNSKHHEGLKTCISCLNMISFYFVFFSIPGLNGFTNNYEIRVLRASVLLLLGASGLTAVLVLPVLVRLRA